MAARNRLPPSAQSVPAKPPASLLGLAFDADDGHKRLTRGKNFTLLGGSQETHEVMQETAIKFEEGLERFGDSTGRLENT